ncbi:MAG: Na+/proline symporter [Glaciecola sp.]|jgi:Na+/proline symporter
MSTITSLSVIACYFVMLIAISWFTSRKATSSSFYNGDKSSPWFLVAFGMIGASLSGITFISVPGIVHGSGMTYMSIVFGYFFGYLVIIFVLLPLYYKLNLTTIYSYLKGRFGIKTYKTGASFFLLSRIIGAALRLYLVAEVLDVFLFQAIGLPYWLGIVITIALIWVYTFKGGIKTIIWTDTIQTAAMLFAVAITFYFIKDSLDFSWGQVIDKVSNSEYAQIVDWKGKGWGSFAMGLVNGAFITLVMTGLDQDMMQKNLTCKSLKESQKNMFWFSVVLIPVNLIFLALGVLLYEFSLGEGFLEIITNGAEESTFHLLDSSRTVSTEITTDRLFPSIAAGNYFAPMLGIVFLVGLIAAAYSSADSALTSLTTCFCVDIIEKENDTKTRTLVHISISILLILVVLAFKQINNDSIVWELFAWAGYTYGPILGFYAFGLLTQLKIKDSLVPIVAIACPIICVLLKENSAYLFNGYKLGFEILPINGFLTFLGLLIIKK